MHYTVVHDIVKRVLHCEQPELNAATRVILAGMLELADRPMPYHFFLLPKLEAMERAGRQEDLTTFRKRFWARVAVGQKQSTRARGVGC